MWALVDLFTHLWFSCSWYDMIFKKIASWNFASYGPHFFYSFIFGLILRHAGILAPDWDWTCVPCSGSIDLTTDPIRISHFCKQSPCLGSRFAGCGFNGCLILRTSVKLLLSAWFVWCLPEATDPRWEDWRDGSHLCIVPFAKAPRTSLTQGRGAPWVLDPVICTSSSFYTSLCLLLIAGFYSCPWCEWVGRDGSTLPCQNQNQSLMIFSESPS